VELVELMGGMQQELVEVKAGQTQASTLPQDHPGSA